MERNDNPNNLVPQCVRRICNNNNNKLFQSFELNLTISYLINIKVELSIG